MSTTATTNLSLIKENGDEFVKTHRAHANANLDVVDAAIKDLRDVRDNSIALLGQLGLDANDDPVVSKAQAIASLGGVTNSVRTAFTDAMFASQTSSGCFMYAGAGSTLASAPSEVSGLSTDVFLLVDVYAPATDWSVQVVTETATGRMWSRQTRDGGTTWTSWARGGVGDVLPVANGGTGASTASDALSNLGISGVTDEVDRNRQLADNVYPGRDLAVVLADEMEAGGYTHVWQLLHARASVGDFAGLRIGDWFDVALKTGVSNAISLSSVRYVIAAFDHYYNCSDQAIGHHIVCVPYEPINMTGSSYATNTSYIMWRTTNDNNGNNSATSGSMTSNANPYLISNLHSWEINEFLGKKLPDELKNYLLDHRSLCESRYSSSAKISDSTGWAWQSLGKVWSPSEMEVYGCLVWGTKGYSQGMDSQFPLFRETKNRIMGGRVPRWLRSVASGSSATVCVVNYNGLAYNTSATNTNVRPLPCFLLG